MRKYYWIAALTVIADQLIKWACTRLTGSVTLIPGVLALTYAENTGMAFSMLSGHSWLLGVVSALCILLGWRVLRRCRLGKISRIAAMLMLGGAVVIVRPSGTEPKIKPYFPTLGKDLAEAQAQKDVLAAGLKPLLS